MISVDKNSHKITLPLGIGSDGSVHINQDVALYASILDEGEEVSHDLAENRHAWIQVIRGRITSYNVCYTKLLRYKRTLTINPQHEKAYFSLGYAYLKKGMLDEAIPEFKRALV